MWQCDCACVCERNDGIQVNFAHLFIELISGCIFTFGRLCAHCAVCNKPFMTFIVPIHGRYCRADELYSEPRASSIDEHRDVRALPQPCSHARACESDEEDGTEGEKISIVGQRDFIGCEKRTLLFQRNAN